MSIDRLHAGPRMAQAVIHGEPSISPARSPTRPKGGSVARADEGDPRGRSIGLLAEAGSDKTKILTATIYLADIATFAEMNAVWDGWVPAGHAPARATVEAKLAAPRLYVEIACIAARD